MKIVADDKIPFLRGILEPSAEIKYVSANDFIHENIKDADILLIRTPDKCTREKLSGTNVQFIASTTIGFDHIDIDYCREARIKWMNCPGCNAVSVSQYMISTLIELSRKKKFSLHDKVFGIVGVGNVGKQVERVYKAYGLTYLKCDPPRAEEEGKNDFVDLQTIAEECDIISFHVPLEKNGRHPTFHLANEKFFQMLKKKPYFINVARGPVHDTQALLKAKKSGLIEEMIIDCWENEPNISIELLKEAIIATPHLAGFSADGKANGTRMCLEAINKKYNFEINNLDELIQPPLPPDPIIDLNKFPDNRIENAILTTFSPLREDKRLRESPDKFEYIRTHYENPREFHAYKIINATEEEKGVLQKLGFLI
ncbi:MAG: 4-phosphoerythronate dehydrogenase PdxB [Candidatus Azobacteroides sp.]|nr:4-phosphoerythronate dehydrogenase PdxB [Candidatus Azobacteroides sp.]